MAWWWWTPLVLSGKHFIFPSILNDSFVGWSNIGYRSLLFITLSTSCQFAACKVSFEKSTDSLMGTVLWVTLSFSLAAFKILSLSLTFGILMMMCLGVFLFGSNLFQTLCASWTCMSISFTKLRNFSFIIFSNKFLISCSFSSLSGILWFEWW